MNFFSGISRKLVISVILISVSPVVMLVYFVLENAENRQRHAAYERLEGVAILKETELNRFLESKMRAIEKAAGLDLFLEEIINMAAASDGDTRVWEEARRSGVRKILDSIRAIDPDFEEVFFITAGGEIFVSTDVFQEGKLASRKDFFKEAQEKTFISDIFFSLQIDQLALTVSTPVKSGSGARAGVLVGRVNLSAVDTIMRERIGLGETGETYLVNSFRYFVTQPRGRQIDPLVSRSVGTQAVNECLLGRNGRAQHANYDNVGTYAAYRWFDALKVCFIAEMQVQEALEPILLFRSSLVGVGGVGVLLMIVFAFVTARSITRPVRELQRGAREIGLGNLDYRFNIKTGDEIEDLAREFDEMRLRLKDIWAREQLLGTMKTEFVAVAAHQLRTPLTTIKWVLEGLLKKEPTDEFGQAAKGNVVKAYQRTEHVIKLIGDLLNVSRIEEGRFGYEFEKGDVVALVREIGEAMRPGAEGKNITLMVQDPPPGVSLISMDTHKLRTAITNVLDNALRYTLPGGDVKVGFETRDSFLKITISDTGIGIPKDQLMRVFGKFFRAGNAIRLHTEGSGLGLFIAKNVIAGHGGDVWVESEEGKGTTVHLTLPLDDRLIPSHSISIIG